MKKKFIKIAKDNGYVISDYLSSRSDMGMVCFEFICNNGAFKFTHYCSYPVGQSSQHVKSTLFDMFSKRLKSQDPTLF
jgi:hypothetical protein